MLGTTLLGRLNEGLVEDWFCCIKRRFVGNQFIVKLLAEKVGMRHLDADGITKGKTMMRLTPHKAEVLVVKIKGFFTQETHGNKSFAVVLINLGINTKFVHATNVGIKLLSEFVTHELHLLILDAGTFGTGSQLLHL